MVYVVACTSACFRGVDVTPDVGHHVTFEKLETGSSSCAHVTHFVLSTELGRARRSVAPACRDALTSVVQGVRVWEELFSPMMVVAPDCVASTTASIMDFVPDANFAISNTPGGLQ